MTCALLVAFQHDAVAQTATSSFDHFSTGFPLTNSHLTVDCASCHVSGRFKATPTQCFACHNGNPTSGKSTTHVKTTNQCAACHQTTQWSDPVARIDHTQAQAPCADCHNGKIAVAKSASHIVTSAPCESCHKSTSSFSVLVRMDHTGITTGCATCHNDVKARGKTPKHIPTTLPCEACHKDTTSFANVFRMDHTGITSGCATCHNNVAATGKPANHVPTNLPCETCHASTVSFLGASYKHQPNDTNCSSCHDNVVAPGLVTPPHVPIRGVQCSSCHTNQAPSFATYTMNHASVAGARCDSCHNGGFTAQGSAGAAGTAQYPNHVPTGGQDCVACHAAAAANFISWSGAVFVHQAGDSNCASCHNGQIATGKLTPPHVPTTAQCSNCHTSAASSFATYNMNHAAVSGSRCDSCHNGSYVNEGTSGAQGTASFANHIATGGRDCVTCHAAAAASFVTWSGAKYVHAAGDTNCASCHNGSAATGMTTPPHIPSGSVACGNCHSNSASSFATYTMNHAAVSAVRCDACHDGSFSGQGIKGALGTSSYPGHIATGGRDCITCHASASPAFATFAGAVYAHQPSDTNCSSCHNGTIATGKANSHVPVGTVQCSSCHSNTAPSFATYTMNHASVAGARCDSCHNGSYAAQGAKGAQGTSSYAGHVATGGQDCATACHTAATASFTTWAGAVYAHQATDTNCSSCHDGATATGMTTPPHIPAAGIQCSNCHTNTATSFTTYTMNHAAVSASRCDSCHNGSFTGQGTKGAMATTAYPGHVFTGGRDCVTCHAKATATFTSWAGGTYQHSASDTNCVSCHDGLMATGLTTPPHIPTGSTQCSNCHANTAASFTTYTMNHGAVTGLRCDACHNGSYTSQGTSGALGTAAYPGHVPTNGWDCATCHAGAAATFTSWRGGAYVHGPSDTNCVNCHNGGTATGLTTPPHIPTATTQCSNCHSNTAASFTTYTMNHAAVATMRCDACHNGSYTAQGSKGATGTAAYPNHVAPAGRDCVTCHTNTGFTSWAGGIYQHQASDTNCTSCHNGTTAPGMTTPPHIPTAAIQCSNCHSNSAASFASYTMNHAAVASARCDSCHNGSYTGEGTKGALGTASYAGHLPTAGQDCVTCHAKATSGFTSWAGASYVHQATDTNCVNCHNGTIATGHTTPPHVPVGSVQCSNCHSNTAASFTTYTMSHAAVSGARCDTCHNGSYTSQGTVGAYGTGNYPGHVATGGQDCITCHAKAAVSFTSWSGGTYTHQAGDTNCVSCHNGSQATGMATPPHIPTASTQCSNCHSNTASSFTTYTMSHAAVSAMRCDACHNGSYTTEGAKGATGTASYPNHVATGGQDCVTCHASAAASFTSWTGGTYVHQAADTACSNCHNGKTALGQTTPPHIPVTGVQCSNCHVNTAASFTTYTMSHAAVSASRCDSCHNGAYTGEGTKGAMGTASYPNHVATNGWDCTTCHASAATTFTSWAGGKYVHQGADTNCASCHNGTIALGMTTPPHIPSAAVQCSNCHTSSAADFTTYVMNHSAVSAMRCDACHNGSYTAEGSKGATGTAAYPNHVAPAGRDCVVCHNKAAANFTSWAGAAYSHSASDTNCSSCHNNTNALGMTTPPHIPAAGVQCSNCHSSSATSFVTYTMNHAAVSASRCDSCHNGSFTAEGTKGAMGTASYAGHVATGGRDCATCHTGAASGGYVSWAGAVYVHQASDTNCSSCHNGTTATGNTTPPHIPVTGIQCSNCHSNTATTFLTYTMNHGAVTASRCDSCHNGSFTAEGTKGAMGTASYAGHVPTGGRDCAQCHASAVSGGYASWSGGTYPHQPSDTNCVSCHNGTTATGNTTPPHIPVTGIQCSNCHSNTASTFLTYTMNHGAVTASRCDACHNGSYTSQGTKGAMGTASYAGHVAIAGRDCVTCHASAVSGGYASWSGGTYSHQASDTNCVSCHNGTNAQGLTTPPHIPTGVVQCSNCHSNSAASFASYTMNHGAVSGMRCDACHNGSYTAEGTKGAMGTASYPNHIATGGRDCITCHASAAASFTSWSGGGYVHLATDTSCSTCHNGATAMGMTTPPHVPSGAVQCSNCHTSSASSFVTYTMNHAAVSAMRCDACHNGSYTAEGTKGAMGTASYANHVATGGRDCAICHANSTTTFASWSGASYVHLGTDTNCTACHNGTIATGMTTPPHIPTAATQCSNCHSSSASTFTTYTMNHSAVSAMRCDACHNGSYTAEGTKGAMGTASYTGHVATGGRDCISCHANAATSFSSWSGGTYSHQPTDTNCISCHNGTTATGMTTPPHVPTGTIQCSNCHSSTAASFTTYTMNHGAVTGARCDSCHNGSYTSQGSKGAMGTASYAGHVPTNGRDCAQCHAKAVSSGYTSWAGGTYTHQATDTNCSSCHNGVTATGATTPPHIPVTGVQCSNCHNSSATSFTTYTMNHAAVSATRCDTCHSGAYKSQGTQGAMGPDHSAKTQDCGCCHVSSTKTFTSWSNPQRPTAGCTTTAKTALVPATPTAQSAVKTAIKSVVTRTMTAVTTAVRSVSAKFGGTATQPASGKVATRSTSPQPSATAVRSPPGPVAAATGQPTTAPKGGAAIVFNTAPVASSNFIRPQGTATAAGPAATGPGVAATAPSAAEGGRPGATAPKPISPSPTPGAGPKPVAPSTTPAMAPKPVTPSTAPAAPQPAINTAQLPSTMLRGSPISSAAPGSGQFGPPSALSQMRDFRPALPGAAAAPGAPGAASAAGGLSRFNHATAMGACANCHNGRTAPGKPARHVPTTAGCETCHKSTVTFAGAKFVHTAVTTACASCHNGTTAMGKPQRHVATTAACETCHKSTVTFAGAKFAHTALTAPCASCHNGATAIGKPPRHFTTSLPCDNCHRTASWTPATYRHASAQYPNHASVTACTGCHSSNAQAVPWKFAAYKPECAGCHATDYRPQPHVKYAKPVPVYYTVAELKDCTGACHVYADKSQTAIQTQRPKAHRLNGGGW